MLLEDLGDLSLYSYLNKTESTKALEKPIDALVKMASLESVEFLPKFQKSTLIQEARLFDEWCLAKADLGASPGDFDRLYSVLADSALDQAQGFVHRDYHSMNIHLCADKLYGVGIIDFQDALWGPKTYDLISLLLDRYITWSQESLNEVIELFRRRINSPVSESEFRRQVLWVGLQRNIRILGVFNRLSLRDSKHIYLSYMPRIAYYCQRTIEMYGELQQAGQGLRSCIQRAGWSA